MLGSVSVFLFRHRGKMIDDIAAKLYKLIMH